MKLTMKQILDKFSDCDKFSLTIRANGYNITEEEFTLAINKKEQETKKEIRQIYEQNKEQFINYPGFEQLYEEIKQECYAFDCNKNREKYIKQAFDEKNVEIFKRFGKTDEEIEEIKKNFFHCSFITGEVGKTTKYGNENRNLFWKIYHEIAMNIDREKDKEYYCINSGKNLLEVIPKELKNYLVCYEISYSNAVTVSSRIMINYYFKLNDTTKKYLLKFKNDFYLDELEDLTLYKDNEIKFYSCTHEKFNSIEQNTN